jgi:hypothetical protein
MHLVKSKSFCPQCIMVLAGSTELPRNRSDKLTERRWLRSTFPVLSLFSLIFDLNLLRPVPVLIYEYFNRSLTLPVPHTLAFPCLILSNPLCSGKIQPILTAPDLCEHSLSTQPNHICILVCLRLDWPVPIKSGLSLFTRACPCLLWIGPVLTGPLSHHSGLSLYTPTLNYVLHYVFYRIPPASFSLVKNVLSTIPTEVRGRNMERSVVIRNSFSPEIVITL